ncbi:hypothetical protein QAD02_020017 [Eretmocerus hayati]|uniref:Uncharacterized protein n=1 Tax=Eretmocerus hayati TaxID=131215 RepID=A0ACC2PR17_9HYME|nr:hypothetical protein QAD02_020017 [Eretmocerus hayati]
MSVLAQNRGLNSTQTTLLQEYVRNTRIFRNRMSQSDNENLEGLSAIEEVEKKFDSYPQLFIGGTQVKIDLEDLDEYHTEKAERELRETPETVQEAFKILYDLLAEEEDLYIPLEEKHLRRFLRRCKWYPKSAFKLIKRYHEFKYNHPEFYGNLIPSNERAIFTSGVLTPLPRRASDGTRVVVVEAGRKWDPKVVSLNQIFRGVMCVMEVALTEPKTQVSGVRLVIDMDGLTLNQVTYYTPSFAAGVIEFVRCAMPGRLKGVHIINQSSIFDIVYAFFKPFLQGKLRDRIYFHGGDRSSILSHIDAKTLPKKYGGNFDFPEEPIGEPLFQNACIYEKYFEGKVLDLAIISPFSIEFETFEVPKISF